MGLKRDNKCRGGIAHVPRTIQCKQINKFAQNRRYKARLMAFFVDTCSGISENLLCSTKLCQHHKFAACLYKSTIYEINFVSSISEFE